MVLLNLPTKNREMLQDITQHGKTSFSLTKSLASCYS